MSTLSWLKLVDISLQQLASNSVAAVARALVRRREVVRSGVNAVADAGRGPSGMAVEEDDDQRAAREEDEAARRDQYVF